MQNKDEMTNFNYEIYRFHFEKKKYWNETIDLYNQLWDFYLLFLCEQIDLVLKVNYFIFLHLTRIWRLKKIKNLVFFDCFWIESVIWFVCVWFLQV